MTTTLEKYVAHRSSIQETLNGYSLVPLAVKDIEKSGNSFSANGNRLGETSLSNLLGVLGIKDDLVNEIKDDASQWAPLHDALSNIKENKVVTAVVNHKDQYITRILNHESTEEKPVDLTNGLRFTEEYLRGTNVDLELRSMNFDPVNISINIDFKNPNADIDVFGDGQDLWKGGFGLSMSLNKLQSYPYFLRLVCSNGMQAVHRMAQRFVSSTELTQKTFDRQIGRYLGGEGYKEEIQQGCNRLRSNNASLREFYAAKAVVANYDKELAAEVFNDEVIKTRYASIGVDVKKQNNRWLASANSNINSYDLFNQLTHTATHKLTDEEIATRMEINRLASDLFFSGPDLASMAPNPFLTPVGA
jgi:hypothetical protein